MLAADPDISIAEFVRVPIEREIERRQRADRFACYLAPPTEREIATRTKDDAA
jgi:hypothetical protein